MTVAAEEDAAVVIVVVVVVRIRRRGRGMIVAPMDGGAFDDADGRATIRPIDGRAIVCAVRWTKQQSA